MAYEPIDPLYFTAGLTGSSTTWQKITTNQRALYDDHGPPIAVSAIYGFTSSGSATTITEWPLCQNTDNQSVKTWILWGVNTGGATGTATIEITDGSSTDSASTTTTSTSPGWSAITVTPSSSSGTARVVRLKMSTTSGRVLLYSVQSHIDPAARDGLQSSGYAPATAELYAANAPVSSERYARVHNGPIYTDLDRQRVLYSLLDDFTATSTRALMCTDSTDGELVNRGHMSTNVRTGYMRVSAYLEEDGSATVKAVVDVGGFGAALTGTGWQHANLKNVGIESAGVNVYLGNTGGAGNVYIRSLVITRGIGP